MKMNYKAYQKSKTSNKRLVTILLSLFFVVTTIVGLALNTPKVVIAETTDPNFQVLKFKQVEAGEDFAIGLTYDNKLYGWSLKGWVDENKLNTNDDDEKSGSEDRFTKKLGEYYPKNPIQINVKFYSDAPGMIAASVNTTDEIKKIATTRTTAAFVTDQGYIYTWGLDRATDNDNGKAVRKGLLFRNLQANSGSSYMDMKDVDYVKTFYEPAPIDYKNFFISASINEMWLAVDGESDERSKLSIADTTSQAADIYGGVDNYVVKTTNGKFVGWGNTFYNQVGGNATQGKEENYPFMQGSETDSMYVGAGYIVKQSQSGDLTYRGKNYYLTSDTIVNNSVVQANRLTSLTSYDDFSVNLNETNAIIESAYIKQSTAFATGFQAASNSAVSFYESDKTDSTTTLTSSKTMALGSDYIYAINRSNNKVEFWGNNKNNQSGQSSLTSPHYDIGSRQTLSIGSGKAVQVVAGQRALSSVITEDGLFVGSGTLKSIQNFESLSDETDNFLSAALFEDGSVYAWNKDKDAEKVVFVNKNGDEISNMTGNSNKSRIVSISKGYGNNLLGLTGYGKIVHIQHDDDKDEFVGRFIETFSDGTKAVSSWTTVGTNDLSIHFGAGKSEESVQIRPNLSTAQKSFTKNGSIVVDNAGNQNDTNIITSSTGDTYRLLVNGFSDFTDSLGDVKFELAKSGAPRLPLDATSLKKYLSFSIEYTAASKDLFFKLSSNRKTPDGYSIVMSFYVGRINSVEYFNDNTNEIIYDAKKFEIKITSADTDEVKNELKDTSDAPIIPMLDPNNEYQRYYSVALMNVSGGFDRLANELSADKKDSFLNAIYNAIYTDNSTNNDRGFPSSKKIAENKGDLEYTLGSLASTYYNNKYQYLFDDVDGDIVEIEPSAIFRSQPTATFERKTVSVVNLDIRTSFPDDTAMGVFGKFVGNGTEESELTRYFNNIYGLKGLKMNGPNLSFSFDIILITANEATDTVKYSEAAETSDLTDFTFEVAKTSDNMYTYFNVNTTKEYSANLAVHIQPSLRLKSDVVYYSDSSNTKPVYGKSGSNEATYKGTSNNVVVFDKNDNDRTINIASLFNNSYGMKFAYNGTSDEAVLRTFSDGFEKYTKGNYTVNLTQSEIQITAYSPGTYSFSVEIRRFDHKRGTNQQFKNAEVIKLNITFSFTQDKLEITNGIKSYTMNDSLTVNVASRLSIKSGFSVENIRVSKSGILSHGFDAETNIFNLKAIKSGTVDIIYDVVRLSEREVDSFTVIVQSISELNENMVDAFAEMKDYYLSTLKASLKALNPDSTSNAFENLSVDTQTDPEKAPKGIYFQYYEGKQWIDVAYNDDYVPDEIKFLESAEILKDGSNLEYLRVVFSDIDSTYDIKNVRIVVKFISADASSRFSIAINVAPSNMFLMQKDEESGVSERLHFDIVYGVSFKDNEDTSKPTLNATNSVRIPVKFLSNLLKESSGINLSNPVIKAVQASLAGGNYTTYLKCIPSSDSITIDPQYPTKEGERILINVIVNDDSTGSSYVLSFYITVSGITIDLDKAEYTEIFLFTMLIVFVVLFVIFFVRLIIYSRRKAQQRRIIRKNQMLIKMRDKMHNKSGGVSKEQVVRTKMKMDDPKYTKMFNEMREEKEEQTGISLGNSTVAKNASKSKNDSSKKKKKGGKKSLDELKAELEAKKMTFAQMNGGVPPAMNIDSSGGMEMDQSIIQGAPIFDNNEYRADLSREDVENQIKAKLANEDNFLEFETIDPEDNGLV